jgi:hypothetical protein
MPAKFQTEPLPMTVHQIHGRETPHSTRKVAQLILRPLATENSSPMEGSHLSQTTTNKRSTCEYAEKFIP